MTLQEFIQLCLQAEAHEKQSELIPCADCPIKAQCLADGPDPEIAWCELPEALRGFGVEL